MRWHNGKRIVVAILCAVMWLVTACTTDQVTGSPSPRPVTVTVTATTTSVPSSPSAAVPGGDSRALAAGFRRVSAAVGVPVAVAIAPVGGRTPVGMVFGDRTARVAWSTIKVPLALATERTVGPSAAETAAIVDSDNGSAEQLWSSLGGGAQAAQAVTAVLRETGDMRTQVPAQALRPGFTVFGQTRWSNSDAATFAAKLPCLPGSAHVLDLMSRVGPNQQWGLATMPSVVDVAVKGGWGPGETGGYLVRQIGLIRHRDGSRTAVALSAVGSSMADGIATLNTLAGWLDRARTRLPRGRC